MSMKDNFRGLDVLTAGKPTRPEKNSTSNPMQGMIAKVGGDLRQRVKDLEAQLEQYQANAGRSEIGIPIHAIDRPDLVMRSEHYWKSERYREIKESIRQHELQEPITVRAGASEGRYVLVKGDTRLTSYRELFEETGDEKWGTIRARVETLSDENAILMMVIENRDREDVCAYDQAVFFRRVHDELFEGDRQAVMELLNISDGWLSKNLTVSAIPVEIMNTYPALYGAGISALYPLAKAAQQHQELIPEVLDQTALLTEESPGRQAGKIQSYLERKRRQQPKKAEQKIVAGDGKVLAEVKQSRQFMNLRIDNKAMPGFAEYVERRLSDIYEDWQANSTSATDESKTDVND